MSESPDFRSWAARVALQATKERDTSEAQRLMSIAGFGRGSLILGTGRRAMPKPKLKRTSGLPRVGKRLLKRRGFGPASLFEPCLTSVVQIALKPASKGLGLRGVFIRGKGLKYAIADSAFKRMQVDAPGACWLDTDEHHRGLALRTGGAPNCSEWNDGRQTLRLGHDASLE